MKYFAVIGNPMAQSRSPKIHQCFAEELGLEFIYEKVLSESLMTDLASFSQKYVGINITVPFKFDAAKLCDEFGSNRAGEDAAHSGAVNTLHFTNNRTVGYNTDGIGLVSDFCNHGVSFVDKAILIIGAGGACAGILPALKREQPSQIFIANRTLEKAERLAQTPAFALSLDSLLDLNSPDIIINTTSAGLMGNDLRLPDSLFAKTEFIYDLSYDLDKPTRFLLETQRHGIQQADGYGMLIEQARESFHIWHGIMPVSKLTRD